MPFLCSLPVLLKKVHQVVFFLLLPAVALAQPVPSPLPDTTARRLTMSDFRYRAESKGPFAEIQASMQMKPGITLLSSAVIPGLGQAANGKWFRAGAYLVADALFIAVHINRFNRAREQEREYLRFADDNWSVVTYAKWLVGYYHQNGISSEHLEQLEQQVESIDPAYRTGEDWEAVNIGTLREVERRTPYTPGGNTFSHVMPAYGSQQYYELISKYYQYGPGWRDFGINAIGVALEDRYRFEWNAESMPAFFLEGAGLSEKFNDNYRTAGNMISLILLNHIISAFDAYLTVKIKNNRLEAESSLLGAQQNITLKYHF